MGMDIFIIALLIFIGLVMVILEVFFLPGITIAGISAVLFFVGAVFYAFMQLGEFAGYITIADFGYRNHCRNRYIYSLS